MPLHRCRSAAPPSISWPRPAAVSVSGSGSARPSSLICVCFTSRTAVSVALIAIPISKPSARMPACWSAFEAPSVQRRDEDPPQDPQAQEPQQEIRPNSPATSVYCLYIRVLAAKFAHNCHGPQRGRYGENMAKDTGFLPLSVAFLAFSALY